VSIVNDFIRKNTTTASLLRAKEILGNGYILEFNIIGNAKKVTALVKGNRNYNVEIIFAGKTQIFTMCNCPYNYQGICKHTTAVLLKFDLEYGDKAILTRKKPMWIEHYQSILLSDILKREGIDEYEGNIASRLARHVKPKHYNEGNTIEFSVKHEDYFRQDKAKTVKYTLKAEGLEVKCNCDEANQCCTHIIATLTWACKTKSNPQFFLLLNERHRLEKKKLFAQKYGIEDEKVISDQLKILSTGNDIIYKFNDTYADLLPIDEVAIQEYKKLDQKIKQDLLDPTKFLPEHLSEEPKPALGLGVVFTFNDHSMTLSKVSCVTAKYNKRGDRLISNFNYVFLENHPDVTEKQQCILEIVSKINVKVESGEVELEDLHHTHPLLRELFQNIDDTTHTFLQLLPDWEIYSYNKIKKTALKEVSVACNFYDLEFDLSKDSVFISLTPFLILNSDRIILNDEGIKNHLLGTIMAKQKDQIYLAKNFSVIAAISELRYHPVKKMVAEFEDRFIEDFVLPLTENFKINIEDSTLLIKKQLKPRPMQKKVYITGMGQFVLFRPFVQYGKDIEFNILKGGTRVFYGDKTISKLERDEQYESDFLHLIKSVHPKFGRQFPEDFFHIDINDMMKNHWFFEAFETLVNEEVEVLGLNELKNFKYNPRKAKISTHISSGEDWFDITIEIKFGDINVSLKDVKKAILKQDRYIKLSDGSLGILPTEWLERFNRMFRHGEVKEGRLSISNRKFLIVEELFDEIDDIGITRELASKKKKLQAFTRIKSVKVPKAINADLRPYQKEGLNWLNFLNQFGWGGILADDMGLGKTLQILTFIVQKKSKEPSLIVVPTTLIFNWENEINKFCPSLNVLFHYGVNRNKNTDDFEGKDLVITTYGMVVNDVEWLGKYVFNYVILDESQAIKNPQSLRFKAVCLLKAKNKLTLTGTPIENNTFDLYAQMHFVNPGLLGNGKSFKDDFSTPIDKDGDKSRAEELRRMIHPFIIRRTKEQVAKELPPKTEEILYCTMEKEQQKVYEAYRNKYRDKLMGKIEADGLEKSKIYVLDGLMKLRQICDSPQLLPDDDNYGSASIKIEELMRNIEEKTGNHKIVVFSQFVGMLSLIRKQLDATNITYEYLDGKSSSVKRKKSVEHFQVDDKCRVFLISLKAGGTGLNLTAADYVFIVDPWWNPAVETQAIDRCYRIGQDKKVFAYRMICKDTIEEKIINYQNKKRAVAADIIKTDEGFVKHLTLEDIKGLFS